MAIMPLSAAKYYLYSGSTNPWGTPGDATAVTQVTDLASTINGYGTSDVVWMAAGTYTISASIAPKAGMEIYGGFIGNEAALTDRTLYDADGNGVVEPWEIYNATIITGSGFSGTSVAYAIFNSATSYTLNGVTIDGHNTSNQYGGAIYTNLNPTITNCIIRNINHTGTGGGAGVYSNATGGVTITGCLIENCVTSANGGAIYGNRKVTVKQSVIRNNYGSNTSASKGGGIYLGGTADAINTTNIVNNTMYNNSAYQGGGIFIGDATANVNILNNTIVNNYASGSTGGIIGMVVSQKYYNNVLYNNMEIGTTIKNLRGTTGTTMDLQYCAYNGGTTGTFGTNGDINNLSSPNFVQPSTTKGYTATMPADVKKANFTIQSNSALKDVGALSSTLSVVPTIDLMGNNRPDVTAGDIGAYEYYAGITNLSYTTDGSTITQNFDILASLGTKTLYINNSGSAISTALGPWDLSDATTCYGKTELTGWQVFKTSGTTNNASTIQMAASTGGNGTQNFYYLGNPNSTGSDVALGAASGTAINSAIGVVLQNNTGKTLTSFTLSYTGEQWKKVSSAQTLSFKFAIGTAASIKDISNGSYTAVSQLNFVTPNTDNTTTPDGNTTGFRTAKSYTVTGISWPNGQRLALRWDASTGQMAIDDVNFSATSLITLSTSVLSGLNYAYGSESSSESTMNVSGTGLSSGITLTPPNDYEISTTSGSGFTSSAITIGSGGTIASTPIYVRLKSGLSAGNYNLESIVVTSTGVGTQYICCSGAVSQVALTISGITGANKVYDGTTTATLTGALALSGVFSADLANVTLGGTYTANFGQSIAGTNLPITVSGYTISGSASGNYSLTQPSGLTANIYPLTSTFSKSGSSNWSTATEWTYTPLAATDLVIASGELVVDQTPITLNSITVNPGAKLTLNSGMTLTTGTFTLQSSPSGTATFVDKTDNGGLIVTGTTTVQQYLSKARNWYVSSPVSTSKSSVVDPVNTSNLIYWYDETKGSPAGWTSVTDNITLLTPGLGYIVKPATDGVTLNYTGGPLNTGATPNLSINSTSPPDHIGFNLIGNPYPSYLNARTLVNSSPNLDKTIWYRTQINNATSYKFDTYNTVSGEFINSSGNYTYIVGTVPPMQAFWVHVTTGQSSAAINFSNSYRTHATADTLNPLKVKNQIELLQPSLRLQVSNGVNNDETLIYSNPNALNGFDSYDSQKMTNGSSSIPELFTVVDGSQLAINGMNNIPNNTEIPLGFTTGTAGTNFSIKVTQLSNIDANTQIVLKDNQTSTEWDLTNGSVYNFNSDITAPTTSRFSVIFKTKDGSTGNIDNIDNSNSVLVYRNASNQITLSFENPISGQTSVYVYNAIGQKLEEKTMTSSIAVLSKPYNAGIYVVSVITNSKSWVQKVVIK